MITVCRIHVFLLTPPNNYSQDLRPCVRLSDQNSLRDTHQQQWVWEQVLCHQWVIGTNARRKSTLDYFSTFHSPKTDFNHIIYTASTDIILIIVFKYIAFKNEHILQKVFRKNDWFSSLLPNKFQCLNYQQFSLSAMAQPILVSESDSRLLNLSPFSLPCCVAQL